MAIFSKTSLLVNIFLVGFVVFVVGVNDTSLRTRSLQQEIHPCRSSLIFVTFLFMEILFYGATSVLDHNVLIDFLSPL